MMQFGSMQFGWTCTVPAGGAMLLFPGLGSWHPQLTLIVNGRAPICRAANSRLSSTDAPLPRFGTRQVRTRPEREQLPENVQRTCSEGSWIVIVTGRLEGPWFVIRYSMVPVLPTVNVVTGETSITPMSAA